MEQDSPPGSGPIYLSTQIDISEIADKEERHATSEIINKAHSNQIVGGRGVRLMEFTDPNAPTEGKEMMLRKSYSLVRFFQIDNEKEQDETGVQFALNPQGGSSWGGRGGFFIPNISF